MPVLIGEYCANTSGDNWIDNSYKGFVGRYGFNPGAIHQFFPFWPRPWEGPGARDRTPFPAAWCEAALPALPIISWELRNCSTDAALPDAAFNCAAFARGDWDAYLTTWAQQAGAWGKEAIVRYFWELDGMWYPWGVMNGHNGNTPGSFIDAWRHVYRIIKRYAPNLRVCWCPLSQLSYATGYAAFEDCYPGDLYVDVLACDAYDTGPIAWSHGDFDPTQMLLPTYERMANMVAHAHPWWVIETGVDRLRLDAADWLAKWPAAIRALQAANANRPLLSVEGICFFSHTHALNSTTTLDFRLDQQPDTIAALKALSTDPIFAGG